MPHELTPRLQIERRLAAQYAVTQILASADSLEDATAQVLGAICMSLDWDWAALWTAAPREAALRCVQVHHRDRTATAEFERSSRAITLARGGGLPGRVWASDQTEWLPVVTGAPNLPRPAT